MTLNELRDALQCIPDEMGDAPVYYAVAGELWALWGVGATARKPPPGILPGVILFDDVGSLPNTALSGGGIWPETKPG